METLGEAQGSIDPETQHKLDKLQGTANDYTNLYKLANKMYYDLKDFSDTQKQLGNHLYEIGVKEEEGIRESLQQTGVLHRNLEKESQGLLKSLNNLIEAIKTFRGAAVQDTLLNLEKYTKTRQEYHGMLLLIQDLEAETTPQLDQLTEAKSVAEENKLLMEKLLEDLTTKIQILNQKRVQILKSQLETYTQALKNYYISCSKLLVNFDITPNKETGSTNAFTKLLDAEYKKQ